MKQLGSLVLVLGMLMGMAACMMPATVPSKAGNEAVTQPATDTASYPVTVENCGRTLTFTQAPARVVVAYQAVAEILIALGLGEKIVGVQYAQGQEALPEQAAVLNGLNWLAPSPGVSASKELLISTQPDLVIATYFTYDLDPSGGAASEADYAAIGAQSYGMATDAPCLQPGESFSIAAIFRDIRTLGTIFGVSANAEALIAQIQGQLDEVQARVAGLPPVPAIYYEDGQGPFTIYGEGLATEFITLAGGQNLLADQPAYTQVSAEVLAALPAEVWVITDYPGMAPVAERADFLYATFPNMPAAQNRRSVGINGAEAGIGIRFPTAIETMAKAFHPEAFANTTASGTTYPVTIENCGNTLTFAQAPARVVSLYSVTTELLLRLGLADRIVAAANFGEALPADLQAIYQKLNLVGQDFVIPREVLLSQKPDLVMDNQPDWFYSAENGFATVEDITGAGAQIYSITAKCGGGRVDAQFEDIYTDIRNMGKLFGVSDRAEALIAEMQATVDAVMTKVAGQAPLTVMIYDAGEGPLGVFGPGSYDAILRLVGGENAFADLTESYAQVSIEAVASREIDVVIVGGYDDTGAARADFIRQTFPNMAAVKNNRLVVIEYGLMNPGVRNHLGVEAFAQALYPEAFE